MIALLLLIKTRSHLGMNLFNSVYHLHKYHFLLLDSCLSTKISIYNYCTNEVSATVTNFLHFLTSTGNKACAAFTFLVGEEGDRTTKFPTRLNSRN